MLNRIIGFAFFLFVSLGSAAQEELTPLRLSVSNTAESSTYKQTTDSLIFLVDTFELPFIDDFSRNRIRSLAIPDGQAQVDTSTFLFTINGDALDTVLLQFDTSFTFISDTSGISKTPNSLQTVVFFDQATGTPKDTLIGFLAVELFIDAGDTTFTNLSPDTILINDIQTNTYVFDDEYFLWTGDGVLWNNQLADGQPTFGVVSFDGTAKDGLPYDMTSQGSYGLADELTSKPINLDYVESDSIYLSFFYQPGGLGEEPNAEDSLTLQFYSPTEQRWNVVWSTEGLEKQNFEQVFIFINDSMYLQKGFQFRFRNYATLSGSFDMWHLDYVQLARFRAPNEPIDDLAIKAPPSSYLDDYTSIPWKQYKRNPSSFVSADFITEMANLSPNGKIFTNYYQVYDEQGQNIFTSTAVGQPLNAQQPSAPSESPFRVQHFLNSSTQNNFTFPVVGFTGPHVEFMVENNTNTTPDFNPDNDTVITTQVFDTYFSYDDGTAEQAYSINEAGAMIAYKFDMPYVDTLKGVLINFPEMLEDMSDRRFRIMVWRVLEEGPIYEGVLRTPTTTGINKFIRYSLADELVLSAGEYYIGWIQTIAKKLYVGFDFNNDHQEEIFYSVNNGINWNNTSFKGSLLIRPDFGYASVKDVGVEENLQIPEKSTVQVYPNPASDYATISTHSYDEINYRLVDVSGRIILSGSVISQTQLDLSPLQTGVYFLHLWEPLKGHSQVETLFIR